MKLKNIEKILIENNEIIKLNLMKENKDNNKTYEKMVEKEKNKYKEKIKNNNDNKSQIIELNGNNSNINEINHEINVKENNECKDTIINIIMKKVNRKDENNIKIKEIDINKDKNHVECSIDKLKNRKQ